MNKKEITNRLNELQKVGYLVFCFSFNRALPKSLSGFPDYLLLNKSRVVFIELKLKSTKDKLSDKQAYIKQKIEKFGFEYYVLNEENIDEIINKLV